MLKPKESRIMLLKLGIGTWRWSGSIFFGGLCSSEKLSQRPEIYKVDAINVFMAKILVAKMVDVSLGN